MQLNLGEKLRTFFSSSRRVLIISKKPTWAEFKTMAKVTGIGIVIIALLGYIVSLLFALLKIGG